MKFKIIALISFIMLFVILSSCREALTSPKLTGNGLFDDEQQNIQESYPFYLQNQEISNLSCLIRVEWNEQGDGVKIFCLNDVAEYEAGPVFEFKFEAEAFRKFRLHEDNENETKNFIKLANSLGRVTPLNKYKVEDLSNH